MMLPADLVFAPVGAAGGPATLFALLVFLIYLGMWLRQGEHLDRGRQPMRLIAVLFTCVIVASYASANRHSLPVLEQNAADRGLMFTFGWLGVLLLAADGIDSAQRLRTLFRRLVLGATIMAIVGAIQFGAGKNLADYIQIPGLAALPQFTDLLTRGAFIRPYSTASHPIEFGAVLVMSLPLALHQARFAVPGKRIWRWMQVAIISVGHADDGVPVGHPGAGRRRPCALAHLDEARAAACVRSCCCRHCRDLVDRPWARQHPG